MNILLFKKIIKFKSCVVCNIISFGQANFLRALMIPERWEALEQSEALALNELGRCINTFASFRKDLRYLLVSLPKEILGRSYNFSMFSLAFFS